MKNLKVIFAMTFMVMLVMSSCGKEEAITDIDSLLEDYPSEITIDNWEEFVHAPQEVLDYHNEKEKKQLSLQNEVEQLVSDNIEERGVAGWVRTGWLGNNAPVKNVEITYSIYTSYSNSNFSNNYDVAGSSGPLCMSYNTPIVNGVTTFDLVLIQRHILPQYPSFTEAYQYIAADVNRDGVIDGTDIDELRKGILGIYVSWPQSDNVIFMPSSDLDYVQNLVPNVDAWTLGFIVYPGCLNASLKNRYVIKTGDVNRSFFF